MLNTCQSNCATRIRINDSKTNGPRAKEFFQTAEVLEYAGENYTQADFLIFVKTQLKWLQKLMALKTENEWIVIFNVNFKWCDRDHFTFSMTYDKVSPENQVYYFPYCLCNSQVNAQDLINAFQLC